MQLTMAFIPTNLSYWCYIIPCDGLILRISLVRVERDGPLISKIVYSATSYLRYSYHYWAILSTLIVPNTQTTRYIYTLASVFLRYSPYMDTPVVYLYVHIYYICDIIIKQVFSCAFLLCAYII